MLNAIFHQGGYFLLPDEFPTYEAFLTDLRSRALPAEYRLIPLLEDNQVRCFTVNKGICMAPYFLSGYRDEPVSVTIQDMADVYPTQVERLSQEEYNLHLRKVIESYCDGCLGYKPLSPKVQSLNGHHEEISLNGVCFFRYEQKPSLRSFGMNLMWLGGGFMRRDFAKLDAEEMRLKLKEYLYVVYAGAELTTLEDGTQILTISPKKKELLPPYLALAIGEYVEGLIGNYRIQPDIRPNTDPETILSLAAPEHREAFRKECKKYGVSIACLTWDGKDEGRILQALSQLNRQCRLSVLSALQNQAVLLMMDTANALKQSASTPPCWRLTMRSSPSMGSITAAGIPSISTCPLNPLIDDRR